MKPSLYPIYNSWQRVVFGRCDKPFRYRKDFSKFEKQHPDKVVQLTTIESILISLGVSDPDEYFSAPYEICDDYKGKMLHLDFFAKPKAIRMFKNYKSVLSPSQLRGDDSDQTVEFKNVDEEEFF